MPLFHFMTQDARHGVEEDTCELPDVTTVRVTAAVYAGDVLRELGSGVYQEGLRVIVTDDAGDMCWDLKVDGVEGRGARRWLGDVGA